MEPDFEQIARTVADNTGVGRLEEWGLDEPACVVAEIAEQLRQVWNARGAADAEAIDVETRRVAGEANRTGREDLEINLVTALRKLDR